MKFKKLLITGIAVLGLASVSGISANASGYMDGYLSEAAYDTPLRTIKHPIELERLSHSSYFAGIRQLGTKWLHKGNKVGVVPFYHMGHDGYVVYVPYSDHIYYAPTNSSRWFMTTRHHRGHHYNSGYVNRTNRKHLLNKSGYYYNGELNGKYSPLDYRSYIPKHFKLKKGMLWNIAPDYEVQYEYEGHGHWDIVHD